MIHRIWGGGGGSVGIGGLGFSFARVFCVFGVLGFRV